MQDMFGSVRRSLVFRAPDGGGGGVGGGDAGTLVEKIGSCLRKSIAFPRSSPPPPALPPSLHATGSGTTPMIRWRKGELIGCGAFGRVYMGMNLDTGELLAVKQVLITAGNASREKTQAHIRELEEEVKLLKTLSHPNIVRYLGTVSEEDTLNILLEFVPGGSISSLLGKFGSFTEPVIRKYTKQLLQGLEYLHKHGIMHRDIKGANILVDNKGCIKLADFGASKQVVELATISGAKSMKGTPYWMAPEVILQTGHSFSADIWSVGCTVIEMATGKPPWSEQYQEVSALFYIGTTKSHPPIPEHLSVEAKDFLQKCLQKEPNLRRDASELLQHPFVTGEKIDPLLVAITPLTENNEMTSASGTNMDVVGMSDICELGSLSCSALYPKTLSESERVWRANSDDDMCQFEDNDVTLGLQGGKASSTLGELAQSFNPVSEPSEESKYHYDGNVVATETTGSTSSVQQDSRPTGSSEALGKSDNFPSPSGLLPEDEEEVTESKITAFLDEKALDLKKLQTPLYEEFYNTMNGSCSPSVECKNNEHGPSYLKLPPKSRSPKHPPIGAPSSPVIPASTGSPGSGSRNLTKLCNLSNETSLDVSASVLVDTQHEKISSSMSFSERQRKWKEELDQELERKREMMRQAGAGGKASSPINRTYSQRDRSRFASPGK